MANISISQMNTRAEANLSDLHEVAYADGNSQTGYASGKMTMEVMANAIVNDFAYQSLGNKTVKGAIEDAEVTVDTALDTSSNNPIANSPVATAIQGTTTATTEGQVLTMESAGIYAEDVSVGIEPIQDLHGYEYPWVGGAGKNIFDFESWLTARGVTYTKQGNAYTLTANSLIGSGNYWEFSDTPINVTLSATVENGTATNVGFRLKNTVNDEVSTKGSYITMVANAVYIDWTTSGTVTITGPQIEAGSQATAYEPYSNICPISGYTECELTRTGVNVWDEVAENGRIDSTTGENVTDAGWIRSKNYIKVKPNTVYYFSIPTTYTTGRMAIYDENKNFIQWSVMSYNATYTMPQNAGYIRITFGVTTYNNDISINYPSTITTYQPYQGQAVTLTFDNTVYSGTLDVTTGVLVVDKAITRRTEFDYKSSSTYNYVYRLGTINKSDITNIANTITDKFKYKNIYAVNESGFYLSEGETTDEIYVGLTLESGVDTLAKANAWLANNGGYVDILYELATPQTIQLTPQQLQMLKGYNTVTTDANGGMTIKYQPDNVVGEIKAYASRLYDDILDRLEALSE